MLVIPVILSGGAGTRLWPVSREGHPKPFMPLPDGETLLTKTYTRASALLPQGGAVMTVTNREHYFASKDIFQALKLNKVTAHYVLEPEGRNTAPAIAVAAQIIAQQYGEDAIMVVMAADHLIQDLNAFKAATQKAVALAAQGHLVTYGIRPTQPETGFGYIESGTPLADGSAFAVERFVEKPDLKTAEQFLASGQFLWNAGMFCFSAGRILQEISSLNPELAKHAAFCVEHGQSQSQHEVIVQEFNPESYAGLEDISIDYAVMERSKHVTVVPAEFDWSDIGSWNAVAKLLPANTEGNRSNGEVVMVQTHNTTVLGLQRVIATVGVHDLIVVDTEDALLIASTEHAQEVRQVAKQLKVRQHETYRHHRTVTRPWGTYTVLEEGPRFKIKRIVVKPGGSLSLQMHHHRSEHWIVVSGMASVINGEGAPRFINTNESTFIKAGHRHRLENNGVIDLVMIEVQSGEYLGEDDIVRFEDNYGRVPA